MSESPMRLYAFQPQGHGEQSMFVMARSEQAARDACDKFIAKETATAKARLSYAGSFQGWGTDYYVMRVYGEGEVADNAND